MRTSIITGIILLLFPMLSMAQAPQGIPYQAVARNAQGTPVDSQLVKIRFSIIDSAASGNAVYVESHTVTTSKLGLFSVSVGLGTPSTGTFSAINWGVNAKFIKVELDATGSGSSYVNLGTQQMMSVPYSLYSAKSGEVVGGSGTGSDSKTLIYTTDGF